jgi:TM2 domain-containing membrane protein YozV
MTFCRGCGKPIHESAVSCPHCGAIQNARSAHADNNAAPATSRVTAGVLALLLGGLGIHKFYTGAWGWGIVYIVLCWTYIPTAVALVEGIRYLMLNEADFQQQAAQMNGPFAILW